MISHGYQQHSLAEACSTHLRQLEGELQTGSFQLCHRECVLLKAGMMKATGTEFITYLFAAYFFYLGNESLLPALALTECGQQDHKCYSSVPRWAGCSVASKEAQG